VSRRKSSGVGGVERQEDMKGRRNDWQDKMGTVRAEEREEFKEGGVDWQDKVRPTGAGGKEELMIMRSDKETLMAVGAKGKEELMVRRSRLAGKTETSRS
jgi:hypothetical protein